MGEFEQLQSILASDAEQQKTAGDALLKRDLSDDLIASVPYQKHAPDYAAPQPAFDRFANGQSPEQPLWMPTEELEPKVIAGVTPRAVHYFDGSPVRHDNHDQHSPDKIIVRVVDK